MIGLLWRTLVHLRFEQIYWRLIFKLIRPRVSTNALRAQRRALSGIWTPVAERRQSLFGPTTFRLLNADCDIAEVGWNPSMLPALSQYNLHYFDDLNSQNSSDRCKWHVDLMTKWIIENPPAFGSGWESYPTSLRIINWIKWAIIKECLSPDIQRSLLIQTRWLARRLEWHLLGNHIFVNAKALIFAGLFFEGPEAKRWLDQGLKILVREVPEQILVDGFQFERSPMYHALALEDMLDLINLAQAFDGALSPKQRSIFYDFRVRIPAMLKCLETLSHPDGAIAFFNDASFAIAPENETLIDYAFRLGISPELNENRLSHLPASGYARLELGSAVVLADIGPIGPDYLPAHAHADTLSFEMSLDTQRLIVNSGTSVYGLSEERHRQRGTAAHSTLTLSEKNSSEVWGGFRVGRRAKVSEILVEPSPQILRLTAAHNGYYHLAGRPKHRRTWILEESSLIVNDDITGDQIQSSDIRFHLAAGIHLDRSIPGKLELFNDDEISIARMSFNPEWDLNVEKGTWHPEFGKSVANLCISLKFEGNAPYSHLTKFEWNNK